MAAFETSLGMAAVHRAQAGLIADMDYVADVLYGRTAKSTAPLRRDESAFSLRSDTCPAETGVVMENSADRAIAIVGLGAILPDAPNVAAFWENVKTSRYSITEVAPDRWDPALYYDPDPAAPDKSYSKIGGWVRDYPWEPMKWRLPIPPRVADAMDATQKWAIACTRQALEDYGYPNRPLNADRTAVILGTAMGGEQHYLTSLRAYFPEYARELAESATLRRVAGGRAPGHHTRITRSHCPAPARRSPKTACRANSPTVLPAGLPISSIFTVPTTS